MMVMMMVEKMAAVMDVMKVALWDYMMVALMDRKMEMWKVGQKVDRMACSMVVPMDKMKAGL